MRILEGCRLVDVLSEWGSYNTQWRLGCEVTEFLDGVEVALTYYSALVCRILAAGPINCVRAEISAEDLPRIIIADSRLATAYAAAMEQDETRSGHDVRAWAAAEEPVVGPLVCTCLAEAVNGGLWLRPPFVVFDGWHRAAAWILQGQLIAWTMKVVQPDATLAQPTKRKGLRHEP